MKPKKAIILIAGLGTRLSPLTNTMPKCLTEINGKSIIANMLEKLEQNHIEETILVIGYLGNKIKKTIGKKFGNMKVSYIENDIYDKTNNSYSLWLAIKNLDEPLLILEGDVFFENKLLKELLDDERENITAVEKYNPHLDGTFVDVAEDGIVKSWIHKKDRPQGFTIEDKFKTINIHKFSKNFIRNQIIPILKKHIEETQGKEPIEFIFKEIIKNGGKIQAYDAYSIKWFEIDDQKDLKKTEEIFR